MGKHRNQEARGPAAVILNSQELFVKKVRNK